MALIAKCLECWKEFEPNLDLSNIMAVDKCPACGKSYYSLNGQEGNITMENCIVDNRKLMGIENNVVRGEVEGLQF